MGDIHKGKVHFIKRKSKFYLFGIRNKLIISFLVPIVFILLLGTISFQKAKDGLVDNYENSVKNSLEMTSDYLAFGLEGIEALAFQYISDNDLMLYAIGVSSEVLENAKVVRKTKADIYAKVLSDKFISNIIVMPKDGMTIMSSDGNNSSSFMTDLMSSIGTVKDDKLIWIGEHVLIDEKMKMEKEKYAFSLIKKFQSGEAAVVIDIDREVIQSIIDGIGFGIGSHVALVGENEIMVSSGEEFDYKNITYNNETDNEGIAGYKEINGVKYYCSYEPVGKTGMYLSAWIPLENIMKQANDISKITILITVFALFFAGLTGGYISLNISSALNKISIHINEIAAGDLSNEIQLKQKDEFSDLAKDINEMVHCVSNLICNVTNVSEYLEKSSVKVNGIAKTMQKGTTSIYEMMGEIESGVSTQAEEAQSCLLKMEDLSERIGEVNESISHISVSSADTSGIIKDGIQTVNDLSNKASETNLITQELSHSIQVLEEKSKYIQSIVNMIEEIASQTNLLSLNASIEAARAGAAGRGFSVVADEIRKLASQSENSTNSIKKIIVDIFSETNKAVKIADNAKKVVSEQNLIVDKTLNAFINIDNYTNTLNENIINIDKFLQSMEESRIGTLQAIENISAITEETAAASLSVGGNLDTTMLQANEMIQSSNELQENAQILNVQVKVFKM